MRKIVALMLLAGLTVAVIGCRARRRPVIVVDAGTNEVALDGPIQK